MNQKLMVSVIIPVYNAEKYIEKCLKSVKRQTVQNMEVLCVDDGSTDATPDIICSFKREMKNLRILQYSENRGQAYARNRGIEEAAGQYIYFLDADDELLEDDALRRMYELAEKEHLDCVTFESQVVYDGSTAEKKYPTILAKQGSYDGVFDGETYLRRLFAHMDFKPAVWMQFWNRSFLQEQKLLFDEEISPCEDQLFTIEAFCKARRVGHLDQILHRYLCRVDSSSREVTLHLYKVYALCYFHTMEFCIREKIGTDTFQAVMDYYRILKGYVTGMAIALTKKGMDIRTVTFENPGYGIILTEMLTSCFGELKRFFTPEECERICGSDKIIIYGTGTLGKDTATLLNMFGFTDYVMAANHRWSDDEKELCTLEELTQYSKNAIVLIAARKENLQKRIHKIIQLGFESYICMD